MSYREVREALVTLTLSRAMMMLSGKALRSTKKKATQLEELHEIKTENYRTKAEKKFLNNTVEQWTRGTQVKGK